MVIFGSILQLSLALGFLLVPLLFVAELVAAVFSSVLRRHMRERWVLHLLWAAAAIAVTLSLLTGASVGITKSEKVRTETLAANIRTAIISYETEYDVPPEGKDNASLTKMLLGGNLRGITFLTMQKRDLDGQGEALDGWGTPFRIDMTDPEHPVVQSAGPDRKWGTADDVGTVETVSAK